MKLISMVDFVFEQQKNHLSLRDFNITNYANFLKQPLELWMFVPCDEDGNVIPDKENHFTRKELDYWEQAKERCLFDGCEITEDEGIKYLKLTDKNHIAFYNFDYKFKDKTIEDYSFNYGLILTATAQKQIKLWTLTNIN